MKFTYASQEGINKYWEQVQKVLEALGYPEAFVTDESMVSDFILNEDDVRNAVEKLNVPLSVNDYIVDIARLLAKYDVA